MKITLGSLGCTSLHLTAQGPGHNWNKIYGNSLIKNQATKTGLKSKRECKAVQTPAAPGRLMHRFQNSARKINMKDQWQKG